MRSMSAMKLIQPEIDKINKKYKNDRQKQSELLSKLYKDNNINPAAGCLPLLIQLPILTAMYSVIREPIKYVFSNNEALYKTADIGFFWVKHLTDVDKINLGGMDLPFILPVLSAIFTYLQLKMSTARSSSDNEMAQGMSKNMSVMMPIMMLIWGVMFPAGLMLYWVTGTIVQIVQQYFIGKYEEKIMLEKKENSGQISKNQVKKQSNASAKKDDKK
jgi:membrane protein insertase, yidC/oxa1 family